MATPRQRTMEEPPGISPAVSGLSAAPPAPSAPRRPSGPCDPATSGGMCPSGGSTIMEVRLPVFRTELKTALYAPLTSWVVFPERALRPGLSPFFASEAAISAAVRYSLLAFAAERSRGTSAVTNQTPWRLGSPHAVLAGVAALAAFAVPADLAGVDLALLAGF